MQQQRAPEENLPVKILTAKQAQAHAPENQPTFNREMFKKVMNYTFTVIDQRTKVGYKFIECGLTTFPTLETRRIKVLKRLGYTVREHEFSLYIGWDENGK